MPATTIESLDHEGRGVAHVGGKAVFIEGALPGETVEYEVHRSRPSYEQAHAVRIVRASALRVVPRCPHYGVCGGCSMQHLDATAQAAVKQRVLEDALWHVGRVRAGIIHQAIHGPAWGYRDRARLTVRLVPSKGGVLVGFHQRRSSYVADMHTCPVLPAHVSALLPALHELIACLSIPDRLPQIEIARGDAVTVLVFRNLLPLDDADHERLTAFAAAHDVQVWLQPGGADTAYPLVAEQAHDLYYTLPGFGVRMDFRPTDFTQVNVHINRLLIRRALQLLDPQAGERIADLFCGLGNFSLPIARSGAEVVGVEGASTPPTCSKPPRTVWRPSARWTSCSSTHRAKAPSPWSRPSERSSARGALCTCRATRPPWRATPPCWCMRRAMCSAVRASPTCSRRHPTWSRWRCSTSPAARSGVSQGYNRALPAQDWDVPLPWRWPGGSGSVAEWLNAPVLKTGIPQGIQGSNPCASANPLVTMVSRLTSSWRAVQPAAAAPSASPVSPGFRPVAGHQCSCPVWPGSSFPYPHSAAQSYSGRRRACSS
jgi:23S rRNA (uracil1939-C5)-methyltransferase